MDLTTTKESCILSIDIGTTYLKCSLFDLNLNTISNEVLKIEIISQEIGHLEIDPDKFIDALVNCVKECALKTSSYSIKTIGISTQRNSFLIWNKKTGQKYSNIILWNDKRASDACESMNKALKLQTLKLGAKFLTLFVDNHRFESLKRYNYTTDHVSIKLQSLLSEIKKTNNIDINDLCYGCIETWILWKLTNERYHYTDVTCAAATGFYDPYYECWSGLISWLVGLPQEIFPKIQDTCFHFGTLKKSLFDFNDDLSIDAIIGDAQSSILAEYAFNIGDIVITMGTGAFLSVNVGNKPLASHNGAYPLVGFKHKNDKIYLIHNNLSNCGTLIEWAKLNSLFDNYNDIDSILNSTPSSNGIVFIMQQELEKKFNDNFIGVNQNTTKAQLLHAIIDSIAFSIKEKYNVLLDDMRIYKIPISSIKICGGVSQSDFICQHLADILGHKIERSLISSKSSSVGAAICAGLGKNLWKSKEDLIEQRKNLCIFMPKNEINYNEQIEKWKQYQN